MNRRTPPGARRVGALLLLAFLVALPPAIPQAGGIACPETDADRYPHPPAGEPAPAWAVGCRWAWSANQAVNYSMVIPYIGFLHITWVSGTITDQLAETTVYNGTPVHQVEGNYSATLRGTMNGYPILWPATGNTSDYYRTSDLALVHQVQHFQLDMGGFLGSVVADSKTDADPPVQYYDWPLSVDDSWQVASDMTVWTKTSTLMGVYESTRQSALSCQAAVQAKENATVPYGVLACLNITYNGTVSTGTSYSPYNDSRLYSPLATNVAFRMYEPMTGLKVVFGLSSYYLNHAPSVKSPLPRVRFPEDTTGTLELSTIFTDQDQGDALSWSVSGQANLSVSVDSSGHVILTPPKDWNGVEMLRFCATDRKGASAAAMVEATVTGVNDPPVLLRPLPAVIMQEDSVDGSLNLSGYFSDPDLPYGDRLTYDSMDNGSLSVAVSSGGGLVLHPFENWSGLQNMTLVCADKSGAKASSRLSVVVLNAPDAPVAVCATHELSAAEDTPLELDLSSRFHDADLPYGDELAFSVDGLGSDLKCDLDPRSGALRLSPPRDYNGRLSLSFSATDLTGLTASEAVGLAVGAVNDPPALLGTYPLGSALKVAENSTTTFSVVASDIDSSDLELSWSLDGRPAGAGPNFDYGPDFSSAGGHNLTAAVSDGEFTVTNTWELTVTNLNRPPEGVRIISPAPLASYPSGKKVAFTAEAADPDGDELTFTWKDNGVKVLGTNKSLELGSLSLGKHNVTVEVSDGNATVAQYVELTIRAPEETGRIMPGFGAPLALLGLALVLLLLGLRRTR